MSPALRFQTAIATLRRAAFGAPQRLGLTASLPRPRDPRLVEHVRQLELAWQAAQSPAVRARIAKTATAIAEELGRRNALVQMPGDILDEMKTTHAIIEQLGRDVAGAGTAVPATFRSGWQAFAAEWRRFYDEHQSWLSRTWYASYEKTLEYRKRAADWRHKLEQLGGQTTAPPDDPPRPLGAVGAVTMPWRELAIAGGALAGGLLLLSVVKR